MPPSTGSLLGSTVNGSPPRRPREEVMPLPRQTFRSQSAFTGQSRLLRGQFQLRRARRVASAKVKKHQMPSFRQISWSESRCSCFMALTKNEELGRGASERGTALRSGTNKSFFIRRTENHSTVILFHSLLPTRNHQPRTS